MDHSIWITTTLHINWRTNQILLIMIINHTQKLLKVQDSYVFPEYACLHLSPTSLKLTHWALHTTYLVFIVPTSSKCSELIPVQVSFLSKYSDFLMVWFILLCNVPKYFIPSPGTFPTCNTYLLIDWLIPVSFYVGDTPSKSLFHFKELSRLFIVCLKGLSFQRCHILGVCKTWHRSISTAFGNIIPCFLSE